jgi:hypothetical protein
MFSAALFGPGCVTETRIAVPTLSSQHTHSHWADQKARLFVPNRRGNPNWARPLPVALTPEGASAFEHLVLKLGLSLEQYQDSTVLREWVQENKNYGSEPESGRMCILRGFLKARIFVLLSNQR